VSRVNGAQLCGIAPGPSTHQGCSVECRWQRVGDLIGLGFEPHT